MQLLCSKHSVFCLWEVRWKDNLPSCLQCLFSADFSPLNQDVSTFKPFHYQFQLERVTVSPPPLSVLCGCRENLRPDSLISAMVMPSQVSSTCHRQTLYSVRAEILPPAGEEHCRSGALCGLEVCITRLTEPGEGELSEESKTDVDGLKATKLMYEGTASETIDQSRT